MTVGIITGASSGLGKEYFYTLAGEKTVDEIWLIARRVDRLEALAKERPDVKCRLVSLDLIKEEELNRFTEMLKSENPDIRVLINNAGFGLLGDVADLSEKGQADMVRLNCVTLTSICTLALQYMKEGSYIINISSIASFVPTPRMTVYSATKYYVTAFTRSLRYELKKRGINALAVCPGPMDTEFLDVAGISGNSKTFDMLPRCNPKKVAGKSVVKAKKGKGVYTELFFFKLYRVLAKLLPMSLLMNISKT
ncbi:MAG: hypothetical protein A2Y17_11830 [Clostridiales bacterium GWF2_38_85]|nr:MAG: hypothetical protein A2Y17_11830 [Clostridiales bacterium GWF2_38_85]